MFEGMLNSFSFFSNILSTEKPRRNSKLLAVQEYDKKQNSGIKKGPLPLKRRSKSLTNEPVGVGMMSSTSKLRKNLLFSSNQNSVINDCRKKKIRVYHHSK